MGHEGTGRYWPGLPSSEGLTEAGGALLTWLTHLAEKLVPLPMDLPVVLLEHPYNVVRMASSMRTSLCCDGFYGLLSGVTCLYLSRILLATQGLDSVGNDSTRA